MIDETAVFLGARGEVARGRAEVVAAWQGLLGADAPEFVWHPEIVELSGDGTLGLSRGPWTLRGRDPQGQCHRAHRHLHLDLATPGRRLLARDLRRRLRHLPGLWLTDRPAGRAMPVRRSG
jgi:ketosteroid isomerase-like protein